MSGAFCTNCEDWSSTPLIPLPCRCHWCTPCLITAFSLSRSEEHYPPKCCSKLNFTTLKSYLPNSLIADLETKILIFETPGKLRVFCAHKTCLMFIPVADVQGEVASCQSCGAKTCVLCKEIAHQGECGIDEALQKTLQLCESENYKQCKNCGQMVERSGGEGKSEGCPHMLCPCGYKFCAHCGEGEWHWSRCLGK